MAARRPKVIAIDNPHAGKHTPRAGLGTVAAHIVATRRWTFTTDTLEELRTAAGRLCEERPDIAFFSGGDGSIRAGVEAVCREYTKMPGVPLPTIMYEALGTECVLGNALKITGSKEWHLARLRALRAKLDAGAPFDLAHVHAFINNGQYGFLGGSGVPVHMLHAVYAHAELGPKKRVLKAVSQALWAELRAKLLFRKSPQVLTAPIHAKVSLPQGHEPPYAPLMTHTALMYGTIDEIGMGFRGLPEARSKPGHFMVRSTDLGFWGLLGASPALLMGTSHPFFFDAVVQEIEIEYPEPTDITIDGEIYKGRTLDRISCGPLLTFITG